MQRLEPVISEMEREGESIVIVSHQVGAGGLCVMGRFGKAWEAGG